MKVNLRAWSRAAATVAMFGLGACNCDDTDVSTLAPSDFPGSSVEEAFLAADGRAFSEAGLNANSGQVQVFRNVSNNDAILVYHARTSPGNVYTIYASYFNGSSFTPPVNIRGADEEGSTQASELQVLFLETSDLSGAAKSRDGDAILLYVGTDADDPASPDRGSNDRAYAAYFDRSEATKDAENGVVHGFTTRSTAIDFDHVYNDPATMGVDEADEDVEGVGFVSDSLHGTHGFGDAGDDSVLSGDDTTFVQMLFYKAPSTGGTAVASRWFAVPFDLAQTGNAFVPQTGSTGVLAPAGGTTLQDADAEGDAIIVNDGWAIFSAYGVDTMGVDTVVTVASFSATGGAPSTFLLGSDPTANADYTEQPSVDNVYGPDHGVGGLRAIFRESGFTNGMMGQKAGDLDLMIAAVDVGGNSRTIVEADAFTAPIDVTSADTDFIPVHSGDAGSVREDIQSRVHRDGGFITVAFTQPTTDITDSNDANPAGNLIGAPSTTDIHRIQVIQTNRPAASLSTSILATPVKVPALEPTGATGSTPPQTFQEPTENFEFQVGTMSGRAAVHGGANEVADAWQSNANVIYYRYTQFNDQNDMTPMETTSNEVRLFTSGIEIAGGASDADRPTVTARRGDINSAVVQFPNTSGNRGSDDDWGLGDFDAVVVDSLIDSGDVVTFFVSNDNNVANNAVTGAYSAERLYVFDGTSASALVSSAGASNLQTVLGLIDVRIVDERVHAFWGESTTTATSSPRVATRSWSRGAALTSVPVIGEAPSLIDLPTDLGISNVQVVPSATRVGVYIQEGEHVYYTETRSDAAHYDSADGLPAPTLVDNDNFPMLFTWNVFRNDGVNELQRSFFVYTKYDNLIYGSQRINLRVHD